MFTYIYIYHSSQPNVGKYTYTVHGASLDASEVGYQHLECLTSDIKSLDKLPTFLISVPSAVCGLDKGSLNTASICKEQQERGYLHLCCPKNLRPGDLKITRVNSTFQTLNILAGA